MGRYGTSQGEEGKERTVISLRPRVAEGENVFVVCHILAFFHYTCPCCDLSGTEPICHVIGGVKVKAVMKTLHMPPCWLSRMWPREARSWVSLSST